MLAYQNEHLLSPLSMYVHTHTQFSGANAERLVAAIKHFLEGKGAEKGLR